MQNARYIQILSWIKHFALGVSTSLMGSPIGHATEIRNTGSRTNFWWQVEAEAEAEEDDDNGFFRMSGKCC